MKELARGFKPKKKIQSIIEEYYCNSFSCRDLWNNKIVNLETGTIANLPALAEL